MEDDSGAVEGFTVREQREKRLWIIEKSIIHKRIVSDGTLSCCIYMLPTHSAFSHLLDRIFITDIGFAPTSNQQ